MNCWNLFLCVLKIDFGEAINADLGQHVQIQHGKHTLSSTSPRFYLVVILMLLLLDNILLLSHRKGMSNYFVGHME